MTDDRVLCLNCGTATTIPDGEVLQECPNCQDTHPPAELGQSIQLTITPLELRCLTFWSDAYLRIAKRYGLDKDHSVSNTYRTIIDRLSMQTDTPLTMGQEVAQLRSMLSAQFGDSVEVLAVNLHSGTCADCGDALPEDPFTHQCISEELFNSLTPEDFNESHSETPEEGDEPSS